MPGKALLFISLVIIAIACFIVMTPIGNFFKFTQMNLQLMGWVTAIVAIYFTTAEIGKKYFFKKYQF